LINKNTKGRIQWIRHHLGSIERHYWVDYFKKFPEDFKLLEEACSFDSPENLSTIKQDIKEAYRTSTWNFNRSKHLVHDIRYGYYIDYYSAYLKSDVINLVYDFVPSVILKENKKIWELLQ
jgi:hypothetical protein